MTGRQLSPTPCRRDADDTTYNLIARLVLCVDELVVVPVAALGGRAWTGSGNPDVVTGDFWTRLIARATGRDRAPTTVPNQESSVEATATVGRKGERMGSVGVLRRRCPARGLRPVASFDARNRADTLAESAVLDAPPHRGARVVPVDRSAQGVDSSP